MSKSEKETVSSYLETLSGRKKQVSKNMKSFIREMVNKYDIDLDAKDNGDAVDNND